jgi:hypothetical protein
MPEKLKDIKDTAADAVEIIRELGTPEVRESLEKVRDTVGSAKELLEMLKEPAMVTNIENFRLTAESFEKTGARIEGVMRDLKESGILDEVKGAAASARTALDSVGGTNTGETMTALKEMVHSISELVNELKLTVSASRQSGVVRNVEEAVRDTREIFSSEK